MSINHRHAVMVYWESEKGHFSSQGCSLYVYYRSELSKLTLKCF